MSTKIELETIKYDSNKRPILKSIFFDVATIGFCDWDLNKEESAQSKKTCKIFLSGSAYEAFQINMPKQELVDILTNDCGVKIIKTRKNGKN